MRYKFCLNVACFDTFRCRLNNSKGAFSSHIFLSNRELWDIQEQCWVYVVDRLVKVAKPI